MLDYEMSNLRSAEKALERMGADVIHTRRPEEAREFDAVVMPGDGHFGEAMSRLRLSGLADLVLDAARSGLPVLGICIGLQVMFEHSDEAPGIPGLGLIPGVVRRLPDTDAKVPHIGWSHVTWVEDCPIAPEANEASDFYFLHSYAAEPTDQSSVWAQASHGRSQFCAAVARDNIIGVQFHPEKSSSAGLLLLERWYDRVQGMVYS